MATHTDPNHLRQYLNHLTESLFTVLATDPYDLETKSVAIQSLGDLWMSMEDNFDQYKDKAMECLRSAQ